MSKTEYRIIPYKTYIADMYLQFKDVKVSRKGLFGKKVLKTVWRFIPRKLDAYVLGEYMTKGTCPLQLPEHEEHRFLDCFFKQESYELIPFTKKYPDIEVYFEEIRAERIAYLMEEANKKNAKTIYL